MKDKPYYKRYTEDMLHGIRVLNLEEVGAYNILIDWMYDLGAPVRDEDDFWAHQCRISIRKWRTIRASLIAHRKIFVTEDGRLINSRVTKEIKEFQDLSTELSTRGRNGRKKQLELGLNPSKTPRKPAENEPKTSRKSSENSENINDFNDPPSANARESRVQSPESYNPNHESVAAGEPGRSFASAKGGWWFEPDDDTLDQIRSVAPGWDRQYLVAQYRAYSKTREQPNNPQRAFLGWCKSFTKGKPPA